MAEKISPQRAIKNHCRGCIYDPLAGGTCAEQIENCTIINCELWHHRPLTGKTRRLNRENYLATLTPAERLIAEVRTENFRKRLAESRQ